MLPGCAADRLHSPGSYQWQYIGTLQIKDQNISAVQRPIPRMSVQLLDHLLIGQPAQARLIDAPIGEMSRKIAQVFDFPL